MRLPIAFAIFLLLIPLAASSSPLARYVKVYDYKESGSGASMNYTIGYDCPAKLFSVWVSDLGGGPLGNVSAYLFYGDYSYQLMDSGRTDAEGFVALQMIGKDELLNKLFIIRLDRVGYKTMEVELLVNCSGWETPENPPLQNTTNATSQNSSTGQANATQNSSNANATPANASNASRYTPPAQNTARSPVPSPQPENGNAQCAFLPAIAALVLFALFARPGR